MTVPQFSLPPTRDELKQIAALREGSLADTPFAVLLLALSIHERTAVIELHRSSLEKQIVLEGGVPVECRSNIATETLGRFLASTGKLSETDYQGSLQAAAARHVPIEDILAERRLIDAGELYRILQQNLGRKLLDAFTWRTGSFHVSGDVPPVDSPLRVNAPQLLLTGIMKFESPERIESAMAGLDGKQLIAAKEPIISAEDGLKFSAEQAKFIAAMKRGGSVDELRAATALGEEDAHRLAYALLFLGMAETRIAEERRPTLELELELDEELLPPPAGAPPVLPGIHLGAVPFMRDEAAEPLAPEPALAPEDAATPARSTESFDDTASRRPRVESFDESTTVRPRPASTANRDELMRTYISFKRKDALELLGLEEDASMHNIVRAYTKFAETFIPSRFDDPEAADSLREKAQEIFLAGARAYAELADPDRRAALISRRARKRQGVLTTEIPGKTVVDPEALYRKGRELSEGGQHREALSYLEMAADVDAQNGTYASELAWCRFQLMISPASTALKALKNALRIDPNCGAAYLYIGRIHTTLGNKLEAEGYLRKAAAMLPRDRRPQEALKALR